MKPPKLLDLAALAAALAVPLAGLAEEPQVVRLTLAEAIEKARAHSARLAQLAALGDAAQAGLRGARAGRLPQLELQASYTRNSDVPELTIVTPGPPPFRQTVFPNIPDNYRTRAALSLPLYTGGRVGGGISAAEQQRAAAAKDLEAGGQDLVLETTSAYWSLVSARESARVLAEAIASYESHLKDARNRLELGMAARNELLAVQVERDRSELARLEAVNRAQASNANLLRLVDLPPGTAVEPAGPAATAAPPREELEALVAAALAARPEAAGLKARIAAAQSAVKVARSVLLPQASLSASLDYARPNSRILPLRDEWNDTWSVGVSVSWSAFDGGRTAAAAAQARAQAEALRQQLADLERRIRLEVTSRLLDLGTAQAQLKLAEQGLEAARENVRVLQDRYREGVSPSSELLDAETALLRAALDRTLAATQIRVTLAGLDRAVGR